MGPGVQHGGAAALGEGAASIELVRRENEKLRLRVAVLEATEECFRATFEQAVVGMAHVGMDGRWLRVNQRMCDIVGYSRDELQARTFQSLTHPDDVKADVGAIPKLVSGEISKYAREKRYVRKDGVVVWVLVASTLVRFENGDPNYFVTAIEDISERKRVEHELSRQNVLLATQQETSLDGILAVDENGDFLSYNRRFAAIWGIPAEAMPTGSNDRALLAMVEKLLDPREFIEKAEHLRVHREENSTDEIALRDGRRVERYSAPMFGPDSEYYGRVWYFRDITERKRLEESLRLTQFSVDTTADAILWIRPDASFAYANDAMCRLVGYTREEMLSLRVFDIDGRHTEQTWQTRWEEGRLKRSLHAQSLHRRKDGSSVPVEVTSTFIELDGTALLCSFIRDITERKRTEEELFRLAVTDSLTGVFNRRYFTERCNQELQRCKRYGRRFSALMLDIDHFKRINDSKGHAAGDEALKAFARICAAQLRKPDLLGRLGGEEFAIALPETPLEGAVVVAERLREAIAGAEVDANGTAIRFTVSIGAAELCPEDRDVESVQRRADEAMYEAKGQGRNRVVTRARVVA